MQNSIKIAFFTNIILFYNAILLDNYNNTISYLFINAFIDDITLYIIKLLIKKHYRILKLAYNKYLS